MTGAGKENGSLCKMEQNATEHLSVACSFVWAIIQWLVKWWEVLDAVVYLEEQMNLAT